MWDNTKGLLHCRVYILLMPSVLRIIKYDSKQDKMRELIVRFGFIESQQNNTIIPGVGIYWYWYALIDLIDAVK